MAAMRTTLILLLFATVTLGAEPTTSLPPAKIISVAPDTEATTLLIRYEVSGASHEQRLLLPASVSDFRFCRCAGNSGIAIVARTGAGWTSQYFYSAFFLTGQPTAHRPVNIQGPVGDFLVLGIGNSGGQSLVITGVRHHPERGEPVSGWLFIDKNPLADHHSETARGDFTTFELPIDRPEATK